MTCVHGASLRDRAGDPADLSRCASQPEALIPSAATFHYFGGPVSIASLLSHYRKMAWREPGKAAMWRMRARVAIDAYRQHLAECAPQNSNPERIAA